MNDFEIVQTLASDVRFRIVEAYAKRLQFPVVLKQCYYSKDEEAEFFIRSVLMKAKGNVYLQPLVSIFADTDKATSKMFIAFAWTKGNALDQEIERDRESQFPSGKAGFEQVKVIYKNPITTTKQAHCMTLGKKVFLKESTHLTILDMNSAFKEALQLVQCTHPNICEILDFRLFSTKKGKYRAYLVIELLDQDLAKEIQKRNSLAQPYTEPELLTILIDVSAALLHAKSVNIAHRDINPSNILRGPQGLKVSEFGSTWLKGLHTEAASVQDAAQYMSPEAWRTMGNPEMLQRPFESDVFSLGMTMLHLAALGMPSRTGRMSDGELHTQLQREVNSLRLSDELKRLVGAMLHIPSDGRPPIETVREEAIRVHRQVLSSENLHELSVDVPTLGRMPPGSQKEVADQLAQKALSNFEMEAYAKAADLHAAAHAIYSHLPDAKATANNLRNWGWTLRRIENNTEAERKHREADALYSHFPSDKGTALNFSLWAMALNNLKNYSEAESKYAAAGAIFSHYPNDKDTAYNLGGWGIYLHCTKRYVEAENKFSQANTIYSHFFSDYRGTALNLINWGDTLESVGKKDEAMSKYAEADTIYSRLPVDKFLFFDIMSWIDTLMKMENKEKVVTVLTTAEVHYSGHSNKKFVASIRYELGKVLKEMGNFVEATRNYEAADAFFSNFFPNDKDTTINLNAWGHALLGLKSYKEATKKFAAADSILFRLCPDGKDSAINFYNWAHALSEMRIYEESLRKFEAANTIFSHLPRDTFSAENYYLWGNALQDMGNYQEAALKYAAADAIYSHLSPNEKRTASNLYNWGTAFSKMGNDEEAVSKYVAADKIYSRHFPNHKETADNLVNWSLSLSKLKRMKEAVSNLVAADVIYSKLSNYKDTAFNLLTWGNTLRLMGNYEEARLKHEAADAIYSHHFPNEKCTADSLNHWGNTLRQMGNNEEAIRKFAAADLIYSQICFCGIGTARNLKSWGDSLSQMGRRVEAVAQYEAARVIYASLEKTFEVRGCDSAIATLI